MDQDEIDALMNGGGGDEPEADSGSGRESQGLTQEDIEAALAGLNQPPKPEPPAADAAPSAAAAAGNFDQSDIDALLNGGSEGTFSQDDIDALTASAAASPAPAPAAAPPQTDSAGRPMDAAAAAMAAAMEEERLAAQQAAPPPPAPSQVELPSFDKADVASAGEAPISLLGDVELHVKVELGRSYMFVEDVLGLGEGSVVELDKLAGDPVDVFVNDRLVARGEVLVLNDNFCVRVSEIIGDQSGALVTA